MTDTITLGSILGSVLTTVAVLFGLYMNGRTIRRQTEEDLNKRDNKLDSNARERSDELKAEITKHNETFEKRLTTLETKSADFMPRTEIEGKIEHERRNRVAANEATVSALTRHSDKITSLEVCVGKVEQKQDGMQQDMAELKGLLREMNKEMKAGFDKIADQARKAA